MSLIETEQRHLLEADDHITRAKKLIADQEFRVRQQLAAGFDSIRAEQLLALMRQVLANFEIHRVLIVEAIARLQSP
jgi:aryl carrier-like protein